MNNEILTDVGLNLPSNYSEDEFFEAGRFLAKIDQGMQWAIGDWYNAIPWGDKKAACEKAGLKSDHAKFCGYVAGTFQIGARAPILTFNHHRTLCNQALTEDQRSNLLKNAAKNNWTAEIGRAHV